MLRLPERVLPKSSPNKKNEILLKIPCVMGNVVVTIMVPVGVFRRKRLLNEVCMDRICRVSGLVWWERNDKRTGAKSIRGIYQDGR